MVGGHLQEGLLEIAKIKKLTFSDGKSCAVDPDPHESALF